ncbi:MAG: fatty acid desaturase [Gammaproteobacteria bacterium]|nr:fatty acid desaturase [Gammaproteobacteria bacterium]
MSGLIELPLWGYILVTLVMTHITIAGVTIYLHRHQAHRALDLHPIVSHFFRFWLWLTTGMDTKQWVAIHRKHHARVETPEDPHSPQVEGISKVLLEGTELYRKEAKNAETMTRFGHGTPDDWMERNVYKRHTSRGYVLMLLTNVVLFGPIGITIWAVQMLWIPVLAAGVINGIGHWGGYRKFETADASTNIMPWGLLIGGEELHNNHHAFASSAKFSVQWWEFDLGWLYIRVFEALGLARVKKLPPKTVLVPGKKSPDADTLAAVIANRLQVMSTYARTVLARVYRDELRRADGQRRNVLKRAGSLLGREESRLTAEARKRIEAVLNTSHALKVSYQFKRRLQAIWQERTASHEGLIRALQDWCREAEASGIRALQDFARTLPSYSMPAVSAS